MTLFKKNKMEKNHI